MVDKAKTPDPSSPATRRDRDSSPELGSPSKATTVYNKRTGRPIRRSAGKMKKPDGYVSFEADDGDLATTEESEDEEDEDEDMEPRGRANKKKRKRGPSLPSPRLEPIIYNQELDEMTDIEEGVRHDLKKPPPITLQFNVPLGFHGPLFVKLDRTLLDSQQDAVHEMMPAKSKKARLASLEPTKTVSVRTDPDMDTGTHRPKGFTDLPPELRNNIYRRLFAQKEPDQMLKIPSVKGSGTSGSLARSSQFLRTCKLVHSEGCSILYGENTYSFHRHYATRAPFWDTVPKEIGYQDVLHFLKMIGPENLQYLRDIKWVFDDACPRDTPYLTSNEQRRYLNDEYLINCLRILRDAKLRKVTLFFGGRRQLQCSDHRFLGYLEQIKADDVVQSADRWYSYREKVHPLVWTELKATMTRKKKLYEKEQS
ncbi:hypothetical protein COCMIDRAFT_21262 [Bipolaris oryzae ATCC 44560]|uniref:Uncharacterized protein n=1 Tax=Bipolaris oryzae ATCC 44560 TaxID=930090 RepID=W6ZMF2_COCMI|nr:uncharacterized protein COCMIDRAFT_21262 [Bipolaris oryzae ATCC 44560]EUC51275.1 hypothetical protein COCMIDRAFT_21262 [Bipolaris oryzae ATCC 44560]